MLVQEERKRENLKSMNQIECVWLREKKERNIRTNVEREKIESKYIGHENWTERLVSRISIYSIEIPKPKIINLSISR